MGTEAAIVERARAGDLEAFHRLVTRYSSPLYRLTYRITRSAEDAEDAVQDAFLKAFERLDRYDGRAAFGTWLYRVGTNCALDLIRRRRQRTDRTASFDEQELPVAGDDPSPEKRVLGRQIGESVDAAMAELTDVERAAFVLRHHQGCSTAEIAEALDITPNNAKQTVFRAVRKLRTALEPIARNDS